MNMDVASRQVNLVVLIHYIDFCCLHWFTDVLPSSSEANQLRENTRMHHNRHYKVIKISFYFIFQSKGDSGNLLPQWWLDTWQHNQRWGRKTQSTARPHGHQSKTTVRFGYLTYLVHMSPNRISWFGHRRLIGNIPALTTIHQLAATVEPTWNSTRHLIDASLQPSRWRPSAQSRAARDCTSWCRAPETRMGQTMPQGTYGSVAHVTVPWEVPMVTINHRTSGPSS